MHRYKEQMMVAREERGEAVGEEVRGNKRYKLLGIK